MHNLQIRKNLSQIIKDNLIKDQCPPHKKTELTGFYMMRKWFFMGQCIQ